MRPLMLSQDGGVEAGWALWEWEPCCRAALRPPLAFGVIRPPLNSEWLRRTAIMCQQMQLVYRLAQEEYRGRICLTVCEYPAFFQSQGGKEAAGEGSLVKLSVACGRLAELARTEASSFEFVGVNTWKGQLSKDVVEIRVRRMLGDSIKTARSHAIDAIGVGLFRKGHFDDISAAVG